MAEISAIDREASVEQASVCLPAGPDGQMPEQAPEREITISNGKPLSPRERMALIELLAAGLERLVRAPAGSVDSSSDVSVYADVHADQASGSW